MNQLKRLIRWTEWLQVQSGLSQGMWMHLRLPREGGYYQGRHEPDVQNAISAAVRPGMVFYDIGAHLGGFALGAARLVGESGRVVAFDGDPENAARLKENSARNELENHLQVVHAAVWSPTPREGITFRQGGTFKSRGGVESGGERPVLGEGELVQVPTVTLDDFIAAGGPPPHVVKIDVEGGEYEVLLGGAGLFAHQRPLIIAEVHHEQAAEKIKSWLAKYQYCAEWKTPQVGDSPDQVAREVSFPKRLYAWPKESDKVAWNPEERR